MKTSYIVRAIRFLDEIFPYIEGSLEDLISIWRIVSHYNSVHRRNILVKNGATRIALITSDYVIKWDYNQRNVNLYGGCEEEAAKYSFAKDEGYEYLLAETTSIKRNNITFNIMPRIKIHENKPFLEDLLADDEYDWITTYIGDLHKGNYDIVEGRFIAIDYAC